MQAEIVTIGTELLLGEIVDTNSAWIAERLMTIGLNLFYATTVGDNLERITQVLRTALERSQVVITTGGLGPTVDDMTREAVAAASERELYLDEGPLGEIACFFSRHGRGMTDNNRRQALMPRGATVIHNPVGTAPCFAVEHDGRLLISLPGVPHEMKHLMTTEVLPLLQRRFGLQSVIRSRRLHTAGLGESAADARIGDLMEAGNPTVGTRAHPGEVDIVITAKADSDAAAEALIAPVASELRRRLGHYVFGSDGEGHGEVVLRLMSERGLSLATVESSPQGDLARMLYQAASFREVYRCGMIYSDRCPEPLGLPLQTPDRPPLADQALADALAERCRQQADTDMALAIVGPSDLGKSPGPLVYYALATPTGLLHREPRPGRGGPSGRGWLVHLGLELLRRHLLGLPEEG